MSRRAEEQRKEQRKQETQEAAEAVAAEAQKAPDVADQAAQLVQFANQVRRPRERVVRNRLALFPCEINLLISRAKRTRSQRLKSTHPLSDASVPSYPAASHSVTISWSHHTRTHCDGGMRVLNLVRRTDVLRPCSMPPTD